MKLRPIAVAIGTAMPIAALAATVVVPTANDVSTEYLATQTAVTPGAVVVQLGSQYAQGDIIAFNYSVEPRSASATNAYTFPNTVAIGVGTNTDGTNTQTSNGAGVVSLFDRGDKSVSYRVTTAPAAAGGAISLGSDARFFSAEIAGTDVTVSTSSETGTGTAFDAGTAKTLIDVVGSELGYTIAGLTQTIDVESDRKKFNIGGTTQSAHNIIVNASAGNAGADFKETVGTMSLTLVGDFSWLDSDTATNATGVQSGNVTGTAVTVSSVSASQIVVSLSATGGTISLTNSLGLVIPTQSLTASLSQVFSNTLASGSATAAGAYTLNGSTVSVYAVPTSPAVSNFIWLTNNGSSSGEVTIIVHDGGTTTDLGVVGTVAAESEFDVTSAMNAALAAAGLELSGGRVHLDIVTKVPAADVAVSAAYRVGDDRVNLLTSLETDND
jgi:hypothetical protein